MYLPTDGDRQLALRMLDAGHERRATSSRIGRRRVHVEACRAPACRARRRAGQRHFVDRLHVGRGITAGRSDIGDTSRSSRESRRQRRSLRHSRIVDRIDARYRAATGMLCCVGTLVFHRWPRRCRAPLDVHESVLSRPISQGADGGRSRNGKRFDVADGLRRSQR